jgi:hypothetical protein
MTAFEFFTVLLSIVVSLGVASLLIAVSRLIQESHRVHFSLTYALWLVAIFNLQITFWLKAWSYHAAYELHVSTSIPPLVLAIIAFLACALATPPIPDEIEINIDEFHTSQVRKYASAMAAFFIAAIAQAALMDPVVDVTGRTIDTAAQLAYAVMFLFAAAYRRVRWLQRLVPVIFIIGSVFYFSQLIGL